jgi:signal transduction histidine kinase
VREARRLTKQLEQALKLSRSLARGLQPVNAVPEGLMIALRELAGRIREFYNISCRFECRAPVLVQRPATANHLYRIAQEAVNNAMKHGRPSRIHIQLSATAQRIILGVRDNGVGIRRQTGQAQGMGLRLMQYRADVISGSLLIQRRPNGGTAVVCTVASQALLLPEENTNEIKIEKFSPTLA